MHNYIVLNYYRQEFLFHFSERLVNFIIPTLIKGFLQVQSKYVIQGIKPVIFIAANRPTLPIRTDKPIY